MTEKSRSLIIQTLVIGLFAILIYLIAQQTAYNLEKRGISSGFDGAARDHRRCHAGHYSADI